jgi:hypothetical protein
MDEKKVLKEYRKWLKNRESVTNPELIILFEGILKYTKEYLHVYVNDQPTYKVK